MLLEVDAGRFRPAYQEQLRREIAHKFGPDMKVRIELVEQIPREKSGKFRMIVNDVGEGATC